MRTLLHALVDVLAPPLCVLCRGPPAVFPWLCAACTRRLELSSGRARCLRCGAPRPLPAPLCTGCPDWPRVLLSAHAAAPHTGAARELVHALKYRGCLAAAQPLGYLAAAAARDLPWPPGTRVVPVPLHWTRRRRRGFNQAAEIARVVACQLGLSLRPRLLRRVRGGIGAASRTRAGRAREVSGAFRAAPAVRGRAVLLVDDVLTTGATVGACARALKRRGVAEVYVVTSTRAPSPR